MCKTMNSNLIITGIIFFFAACSEKPVDPPPPPEDKPITATLALADTGLVELALKLKLQNAVLPISYTFSRNKTADSALGDTLINSGMLTTADTLFYDSGLTPQTAYHYRLLLKPDSTKPEWQGFNFTLSTMDTTSHDFSWQVFEFGGEVGSSYLNDVAIVNENDIWAVGSITVRDSAGVLHNYNAVHWDGETWELKRIPFTGSCSAVEFPITTAIISFAENDIWISRPGSLVHWDGSRYFNDCGMNALIDGSINKIWGTSSNDLYVVGNNGTIVHYNGSRWQKLESGTDIDLTDVWGLSDGSVVWACGWTSGEPYSVLLSIRNNRVTTERYVDIRIQPSDPNSLAGNISTGIFLKNTSYIASSRALYTFNSNGESNRFYPRLRYFPSHMDATNVNNIWVCGDRSMLWHFNGSTPKYIETDFEGHFNSISVHSKVICAVGESFDVLSKAKIILLKP